MSHAKESAPQPCLSEPDTLRAFVCLFEPGSGQPGTAYERLCPRSAPSRLGLDTPTHSWRRTVQTHPDADLHLTWRVLDSRRDPPVAIRLNKVDRTNDRNNRAEPRLAENCVQASPVGT